MEKSKYINYMKIIFDAKSENEALARVAVAGFVMQLDPTLEELNDIKTAVSEAVTNAIIHGYDEKGGEVELACILTEMEKEGKKSNMLTVKIVDGGVGIEDIKQAMEPLYTSKPELERSGMGFTFMELFMDKIQVDSGVGTGTCILMEKIFDKVECIV